MTNCAVCGANLAMVGRLHRCIPRSAPPPGCEPQDRIVQASPGSQPGQSGTYKYRDPDKWRAYMRDYMRKKRKG